MTILKDLIKLRASPVSKKKGRTEEDMQAVKLTYFQQGFGDSKDSMGHPSSFSTCLRGLYEMYKEKCRIEEEEQIRLKQPLVEDRNRVLTEIEKKETFIAIKQSEMDELTDKIRAIDHDVVGAKTDPSKYNIKADKRPKAQFYIGLVVLLPVTAYLIVFYMSASYSAFFKEFSTNALTAAIFDARAFSKALRDGVMEMIFVSTIPFAFMGLGYLIHMFQKSRAIAKIVALFAVTFVFDAILAYQIEKKIYDFNRTLNSPDFDVMHAFQSVDFWGIIFAGFVVYIIWGLVFDFIMKEYDNLDRVEQFIKKLKEDKNLLIKNLNSIKELSNSIVEEIAALKGRARELQAKIDGFIFPKQKYLVFHAEYAKGWIKAIFKEIALPRAEKDRLVNSCQEADEAHLAKYGLKTDSFENIMYYTEPDTDD